MWSVILPTDTYVWFLSSHMKYQSFWTTLHHIKLACSLICKGSQIDHPYIKHIFLEHMQWQQIFLTLHIHQSFSNMEGRQNLLPWHLQFIPLMQGRQILSSVHSLSQFSNSERFLNFLISFRCQTQKDPHWGYYIHKVRSHIEFESSGYLSQLLV